MSARPAERLYDAAPDLPSAPAAHAPAATPAHGRPRPCPPLEGPLEGPPEASAIGAPRAPCTLCGRRPLWRRDLCRSCYRKLSECGLPLPRDRRTYRQQPVPVEVWLVVLVTRLPRTAQQALREALDEVSDDSA